MEICRLFPERQLNIIHVGIRENEMLKQLFASIALATAFAATPVLAGDNNEMTNDDPEFEQEINESGENTDNESQGNISSPEMKKTDSHKKMNKDDPEWEQEINETEE